MDFILKLLTFIVLLLGLLTYYYNNYGLNNCSKGYFRIGDMKSCHKLLDCNDYKDMKLVMFLNSGLVKNIYLVKWKDNYFILSNLTKLEFSEDFLENIQNLESLSPNRLVVQLIGSCGHTMLFTEYHPFGDANSLSRILNHEMTHFNNISIKFNFCIDYVRILHFLHNSPIGTRVMCDSNYIEKILSQYLITDDMHLIVNDLDAVPEVKDSFGVKCGHRQLFGTFVAPEQLWPFDDKPFVDEEMPGYNEKSDIWKIPDVCHWFLTIGGQSDSVTDVMNQLVDIHRKCKSVDPKSRPDAQEILNVYQKIYNHL